MGWRGRRGLWRYFVGTSDVQVDVLLSALLSALLPSMSKCPPNSIQNNIIFSYSFAS